MPSPGSDDSAVSSFVRELPKAELHLHIEGSIPFSLLQRSNPSRYQQPPASWAEDYRFSSFAEFEHQLLNAAGDYIRSADQYFEAATVLFRTLRDEHNVRYIETSFASGAIEVFGVDGAEVAKAIRSAAPEGVEVRVFLGIHHNGYHAQSRGFLEDSLFWPDLDGIDLHGTETFPLEEWTANFWARAREAGKYTKAHAGEFCGPEFVRRVIRELGVKRIEHGVKAAEDPTLVRELAEAGITLDVCPISNVKLGVVRSMADHPIGEFLRKGVRCTISTDDPMVFGNTLQDEYMALHRHQHLTATQLAQLAINGFEVALVDEAVRSEHISRIRQLLKTVS